MSHKTRALTFVLYFSAHTQRPACVKKERQVTQDLQWVMALFSEYYSEILKVGHNVLNKDAEKQIKHWMFQCLYT